MGYFGFPIAPNGPCEDCHYAQLCKRVKTDFVPVLAELSELKKKCKS
jgi:hypothetical protein